MVNLAMLMRITHYLIANLVITVMPMQQSFTAFRPSLVWFSFTVDFNLLADFRMRQKNQLSELFISGCSYEDDLKIRIIFWIQNKLRYLDLNKFEFVEYLRRRKRTS